MMNKIFDMPIEICSEANIREHWAKTSKRVKQQNGHAYGYCLVHLGYPREWPGEYRITLTRMWGKGQRKYDGDNLQRAFKAVRDGIAKYLKIDDGSDRLEWLYFQCKGDREFSFVRVRIEALK